MRGFASRADVGEVLRFLDATTVPLEAESVELRRAAGRVLAQDVLAPCDVPPPFGANMVKLALSVDQS